MYVCASVLSLLAILKTNPPSHPSLPKTSFRPNLEDKPSIPPFSFIPFFASSLSSSESQSPYISRSIRLSLFLSLSHKPGSIPCIHQGRMGSSHLGIMGLNGCSEFRNQALELFQIACFICMVENLSVNFIVYAPLTILIQAGSLRRE